MTNVIGLLDFVTQNDPLDISFSRTPTLQGAQYSGKIVMVWSLKPQPKIVQCAILYELYIFTGLKSGRIKEIKFALTLRVAQDHILYTLFLPAFIIICSKR